MVAALAAAVACQPSLEGKNRCRTDGDCAAGRVCVSATCIDGSADTAPSLFITSHTDDLLFFMNPDVEKALRSGKPSRAVVVSSGDAGGQAAETRSIELQTLAVFARMAGTEGMGDWSCAARPYAGKATHSCQLASAPSIEVTFLRLQASNWPEVIQLPALWGRDIGTTFSYGPVAALAQVIEDGDLYSREDLIEVLAAIIDESQAQYVGISDPTWTYGADDPDNTAAGRFAMEAAHRAKVSTVLRLYRGYNIYMDWEAGVPDPERRNLTQSERDRKVNLLDLYYDGFAVGSRTAWNEWCWRRYTVRDAWPGTGKLRGSAGCLQPPAIAGGMPTIGECTPNGPAWELRSDHSIAAPSGDCLTMADDERSIVVNWCRATPNQKWTLLHNGQLHGMNGGCLSIAADGVTVTAEICGSDRSTSRFGVTARQQWILGEIAPAP
jgi:LmbE family N-acetylglucosaminyl deacetylase